LIKYFAEMENVRKQGEAYLVLLLFASFLVLEFFLILEFEHGFMDQGFLVASGFAAYLLLVVISYILLSNPDVEPDWGTILLGLGLVVLITPGYVIIKTMREIISTMPIILFFLVILLWPIFYLMIRDFIKPVSNEDELLILLYSLGAVLFFPIVLDAGVALTVLVTHLYISKRVWILASRARERASGKPLPKLFK